MLFEHIKYASRGPATKNSLNNVLTRPCFLALCNINFDKRLLTSWDRHRAWTPSPCRQARSLCKHPRVWRYCGGQTWWSWCQSWWRWQWLRWWWWLCWQHTSYLSRISRIYPCKIFLPGVNFYRFNAKNWQTLAVFGANFGVNWQKLAKIGVFRRKFWCKLAKIGKKLAKNWRFML